MRFLAVPFSIASYFFGFASLVFLILFVGDLIVPWTINEASPVSPGFTGLTAVVANIALITIWGLQHSIMADPSFKRVWIKIVPPAVERSTYVLFVGAVTFTMIALWSPLPTVIWDVSGTIAGPLLIGTYFTGWTITLISTFLINHFHLFGLQQAFQAAKSSAPGKTNFVTPFFYKLVRHPMMTGVLIALWSVPTLTAGRLVFNVIMTAYILLGTRHEEKALVAELGQEYEDYRKTTPMLLPSAKRGRGQ
jgi:protein-S-isoprenylcysteine O-methyltransferase Ste14